jgi:hypothetical protein
MGNRAGSHDFIFFSLLVRAADTEVLDSTYDELAKCLVKSFLLPVIKELAFIATEKSKWCPIASRTKVQSTPTSNRATSRECSNGEEEIASPKTPMAFQAAEAEDSEDDHEAPYFDLAAVSATIPESPDRPEASRDHAPSMPSKLTASDVRQVLDELKLSQSLPQAVLSLVARFENQRSLHTVGEEQSDAWVAEQTSFANMLKGRFT